MNIYKISQEINQDYDSYDSAIVIAKGPDEAQRMNPGKWFVWNEKLGGWCADTSSGQPERFSDSTWVDDLRNVTVEWIGTAPTATESSVVLASFNAG